MGRSPCCDDISGLKKGPWTPEEDDLLTSYIQKHGHGSWRALPKMAGLNRCGKSCRLRWTNYLRPDIKRGRFTEEEEDNIIKLHSVLGNKWSRIAAHLPGRTDNEIKNYWNTHLRKKLLQMGIDPVTHKPRTDLNLLSNLSQLFTTPQNLSTLINPWDINNSLRLQQPNVAELAKLQVLQNIIQILNTNNNNSLSNPSMMPLNLEMIPNFSTFSHINNAANNNNNNNISSNSQEYNCVPNNVGPSHVTRGQFDSTPESFPRLDTYNNNYNNNNNNNKSNLSSSYETLDENKLPSLINLSPESSTINQFESNNNSTNGSSSVYTPVNGDFFDGLEKLLDDGNSDLWKEFIN